MLLLFSDGVPIDDPCDAPRDGGSDAIVHNYVVVVGYYNGMFIYKGHIVIQTFLLVYCLCFELEFRDDLELSTLKIVGGSSRFQLSKLGYSSSV